MGAPCNRLVGAASGTRAGRSLWDLLWACLWVQVRDMFRPFGSTFTRFVHDWYRHYLIVITLAILLLVVYLAFSLYFGRRRVLRRFEKFGNTACIGRGNSGLFGKIIACIGRGYSGFVLDSGSFYHATGNMGFFDQASLVLRRLGTITVGDGSVLEVCGHGAVNLVNLTLACVLYVPGLIVNVVSVSQLTELDYQVQFIGREFFVREICTDAMVGRGRLVDGMYQVDSLLVPLDGGRCINCLVLGRIYDQS